MDPWELPRESAGQPNEDALLRPAPGRHLQSKEAIYLSICAIGYLMIHSVV